MNYKGIRSYIRKQCVVFRKTNEKFGGLSNMAPGFPIVVNGFVFKTSEALYQACRYPHLPEIQHLILNECSPMTAKMKSKPYRPESRADWDQVRITVMQWCLRAKLLQNYRKFSELLLQTDSKNIVEDSHKDNFWGAIPQSSTELVGQNILGRLLMQLREELVAFGDSHPQQLFPPTTIENFYLLGEPIQIIRYRSVGNDEQLVLWEDDKS
ncbi:NADAR family protein [Halodesulfovibrio sp.]|uniref:NADAR family protein n=1 Tax=Halodesulfovibrio sp. TaxID=1912772 RepID=UPI0025BC5154|nr:NADAR family protein [Halodesulfovibrio sp.]